MSLRSWAARGSVAISVASVLLASAGQANADSVPFTDTGSIGYIGFCDKAGNEVTSGNINDKPFVWTAVSSVAPPTSAYTTAHKGKATLYAVQPRQQVDPGDWSGYQLTASAAFTSDQHPMAQATTIDYSLAAMLEAFPAQWDGLVELRMLYTAPNTPAHTTDYPSAVIKVTGDRWNVVRGGTPACNAGKAVSAETVLLPAGTFLPPPPSSTPALSGSATPNGGATAGTNNPTASATKPSAGETPTSHHTTGNATTAGKPSAAPSAPSVGPGATAPSNGSTTTGPASAVRPGGSPLSNTSTSAHRSSGATTAAATPNPAPSTSLSAASKSGSSSGTVLLVAVVALLAILAGSGLWWSRRRRA